MLGEIPLKTTLQGWMSNLNRVTRKAFWGICLITVKFVFPIALVYAAVGCFLSFDICWSTSKSIFGHIRKQYLAHIHPWVMLVVSWIKGICYGSFRAICLCIIALIAIWFFKATYEGFLSWIFVIVHGINVYLSKSMGVRNSTIHLDTILKIDNFTCSNKKLVMAFHEVGILHTDLSELTKNSNMTQTELLIAGSLMSLVIKPMRDAKHNIEMNEIEAEFIVNFIIYWLPESKHFKILILYSPYFYGVYRYRRWTELGISIIGIILLIILYVWLLWIRYLEHGLFGAIFHWNTCLNGICISVLLFIWSSYTSWVAKSEAASQDLERATSRPGDAPPRSARGRSPRARRAA
jgi:hypothetical protein